MEKKLIWVIKDISTYLEVYDLAKKHGKNEGDDMTDEFMEIYKKSPEKFQLLGTTDKDVDLLTGNLREKGLKIINLKEIERRRKLKDKE